MEKPEGASVPPQEHASIEFQPTLCYFQHTKEAGRPVGYCNLGEVNKDTDTQKILEEKGLNLYPYLAILHYQTEGKHIIEVASRKFQPNQKLMELTKYNAADLGQLISQLAHQVMAAG